MLDQPIQCLTHDATDARPLHVVRPAELPGFLSRLPQPQALFLQQAGFRAARNELHFLPGPKGIEAGVAGIGDDRSLWAFGPLPDRLPEQTTWSLVDGDYDNAAAALGFALGAYRFDAFKATARTPARLLLRGNQRDSVSQAAATWMARDLVNTPPNLLGPQELARHAVALAERFGARAELIEGDSLQAGYPTVAAVGNGSTRLPAVVIFRWQGSTASNSSPLVSFCGKGVCFDTGGYDLKPSAGMLRMKKDMAGAAVVLGVARMIMEADLPVRLAVRVGCVENSVSGTAMRPSDVIRTRSGQTVEIGNTDAEGRLVLCDLLSDAATEAPAFLVDCATLTGAARVALGPDLPALFCNDDTLAESLLASGTMAQDPLWRLPLWAGYDDWLSSPIADTNNVSSKSFAGSIVAALFLQRFVGNGIPWAHLDLYGWNDSTRPGRPEGGEAQAMRALFTVVRDRYAKVDQM